jgi:hypothetical protein
MNVSEITNERLIYLSGSPLRYSREDEWAITALAAAELSRREAEKPVVEKRECFTCAHKDTALSKLPCAECTKTGTHLMYELTKAQAEIKRLERMVDLLAQDGAICPGGSCWAGITCADCRKRWASEQAGKAGYE